MIERLKAECIAVWGAGKSGIAAAHLLAHHGCDVTVYDDRATEQLEAQLSPVPFNLVGGGLSFEGHTLVVLSPGIPPHSQSIKGLLREGIAFVSEVEVALMLTKVPVVAITGTDGKSTTSAMIDHVLNCAGRKSVVCGNFGIPVSTVLLNQDTPDCLVVEISAFQLWSTQRFEPKVAVITNIAEDHLDYFEGSFERYRDAKLRVFRDMRLGQVVFRQDCYDEFHMMVPDSNRVVAFEANAAGSEWAFSDGALTHHGEAFLSDQELRVVGLHNVNNALSAAAASHFMGVELSDIAAALSTFTGLPHRMEYVRTVSGVDFYNDSKATNPHAAQTGIAAMGGSLVVIAGGYDKGLDLKTFATVLSQQKYTVLTGPAGHNLLQRLQQYGHCVWVESMAQAVEKAMHMAEPGDRVILAPGSSSFDAFRSFEHRGDEFKKLVGLL